jgi:predicted phage terminase large subunit-like protein
MPITTRVKLHNERVIWPAQRSYEQVLSLKAQTIPAVWETTYQSDPVAAGGTIFKREWWHANRFDITDMALQRQCVARWISWDTALKDKEANAYTSYMVGELLPDYRVMLRRGWRDRLGFADLPREIEQTARAFNEDHKLRAVIIEDKASGISAHQTLMASSEQWLSSILVAFQPSGDKDQRANQGAVWCRNGCVLIPHPSPEAPWLHDFETELFSFPGSAFKDQVDAFSQLIIYIENLLAEGWRAGLVL